MHVVLHRRGDTVRMTEVSDGGAGTADEVHVADEVHLADLPAAVARREFRRDDERPRWVWDATAVWYPDLLAAGVRVDRAHDLRLARTILRHSAWTAGTDVARAEADDWDAAPERPERYGRPGRPERHGHPGRTDPLAHTRDALFDLEPDPPATTPDPVAELLRQRAAIAASAEPARLALLVAAESVGALAAVEMHHAGLPWDAVRHDAILREHLGDPAPDGRPARLEELADRLRAALDAPALNPDSQPDLLRALQHAGLRVESTAKWELARLDHPAVPLVLEYKALSRLLAANGWAWLEQWVRDGRFRPVYVPGGVVTGRWASDGGGALQLPRQVRAAVVADPGWKLVVADAAQLEPRVLGAMARDDALAAAGRHADLYQGMVDSGAVETRQQAKYGVLGAIYGGTTGESGRMRPRIERTYPAAFRYVEQAARAGERGEVVTTWLGRSSPPGDAPGYDETASPTAREAARRRARDRGRFTRNFVVQGTAAEWALCWIGSLRRRLWEIGAGSGAPGGEPGPGGPGGEPGPGGPGGEPGPGGPVSGPELRARPHLAFFVHDELVVHAPAGVADRVADAMRESAADAGRLLFGSAPVEFAVSVAVVDCYADAT